MIALEVEFLTGRYVAATFDDRGVPEWPPHPARLFSALVATAHDHEELTKEARVALAWLEEQGPPRVFASQAQARAVVTVYVPENTTRVLGGWGNAEAKLAGAVASLAQAEHGGDAKAVQRAKQVTAALEAKLSGQFARAVADEAKANASNCAQAQEMLPERRGKQPRTLPSVTPEESRVVYSWPDAEPDASTEAALSLVAARVVRLGHSSSLVSCRFVKEGDATKGPLLEVWEPSSEGEAIMRTVGRGQVGRLERAFERHKGMEPRVLPAVHQPYRKAAIGGGELACPVFGEWIVLKEVAEEGRRRIGLRLPRTEDVTRALRGALLKHADDPPVAVLSGHGPDGLSLKSPHVAFLTLGDVTSRHASGSIIGCAVVLPRDISTDDRRAVLRAIGRWEQAGMRLVLGRAGELSLERIVDRDPRSTLDPDAWVRPARRWASITPVALDKNPGNLFSREPEEVALAAERAEDIVATACEHIGLPRPKWVEVVRRSLFDAAPAARDYMPFPRKEGSVRRVCVHVEMCFKDPIAGPVVIGAGRYFGLGLCKGRRDG